MSEPRLIKEIVVNEDKYLTVMPFTEFCAYFESLKNMVPEEYFSEAKISISDPPPTGGNCNVIVSYRRLETEEEVAARDKADADAQAKKEAERIAGLVAFAEANSDVLQVKEGVYDKRITR